VNDIRKSTFPIHDACPEKENSALLAGDDSHSRMDVILVGNHFGNRGHRECLVRHEAVPSRPSQDSLALKDSSLHRRFVRHDSFRNGKQNAERNL
jgi:hypothetical protein